MDWTITTYDPSLAASVAQMWNESDEGWPGGFTGGVPFTEERVRDWLGRERPIDIFLVMADNRAVAYCSLYEYGHEPTAAYVALLNCHPRYWKHGFGRELLKRAVARSTELGYKRLDLHTWTGNLRAVPLYKKTGFFWQPESQVHMLNFLPAILPLAGDFFAGADWYTTYQRELLQIEDDITWRGMKVYPYSFQKDGHMLKAVIDRESRGLTAFENDDYSVACLLDTHKLIAGVASPVRWEIVNKTAAPLTVSLLASGEAGLNIHKQVTLTVSERALIEGEVLVDSAIVAHEKVDPAHKINSTLVINGRLLSLETGVRPQQAVEITPDPTHVSLTPGLAQTVHLRLKNNLGRPARARLTLLPPPGVTISNPQQTIDLPADGYAGATCTILTNASGAPAIIAAITAESDNLTVTVKPVRLPIAAPGPGKPAAYLRQDQAVLENEHVRLVLGYKDATVTLFRKSPAQTLLFNHSHLGPPFYPNEFRSMRFNATIEQQDGAVSVILSANSRNYAGVTFERVFSIDSSPLVTIGHRVHNTGAAEHSFQIRTMCSGFGGEISMALPTKAGLVVDMAPSYPDWQDDASRKPESLSESWMAINGKDSVVGVLWQGATEQTMDAWDRPVMTLDMPTLPPFGHTEAPPLRIYAGPGDWHEVRRSWRRLVNPAAPEDDPEPRRVLVAQTTPSPLLIMDGKAESTLRLDSQRNRGLSGSMQVTVPAPWTITPSGGDFSGLKYDKPFDLPIAVHLGRGKGPMAAEGSVTVKHEFGEEQRPLPLLALGKRGGVNLTEYDEQGRRLVGIDNGWMRLVVAPDHIGSVIALEQGGANHLLSSYPAARPFSWMSPWHGGVSPVVFSLDDDDPSPGNPGRMWEESWTYELLRPWRGAAVPWTGVRTISNLQRERLRGLRLEMDYTTVGASNVMAVTQRLVNTTSAPFTAMLVTQAYVQPGGDRSKAILRDLSGRHVQRLQDHLWGADSGHWAGVSHNESGQCVAMVGTGKSQIIALDFGLEGAHLFNVDIVTLGPLEQRAVTSYLVLAPDLEQARLYRWLERLT